MNRRRSLTTKEKLVLFERQGGRCSMCGDLMLFTLAEAEHWVPVALGNGSKPDSLMHALCHRRKTRQDVKAIAKVKRLQRKAAGLTKPKRKIASRGFDKRLRKIPSRQFDKRKRICKGCVHPAGGRSNAD